MENESVSSNIMDIIQRNLQENRAILSQIVKECHDDHRSCITPVTFKRQKPRESRRSLMEFIEIRRNPDRKARSYANVENTQKRIPIQDRSPLSGVSSNSVEIFQEDSYDDWKPSNNKRMKMATPLSEVRKAEEVTEEELMRVIIDPRIKKEYRGSQLSTCHQCRQKTQDMKTICRSGICRGVQGQFCGVCLYNRYGENAKEALLDDNWSCPVCRNICNCSFCLPKKGKRCTGILVPVARRHGFTNVHSFLDSLSKNKSEV